MKPIVLEIEGFNSFRDKQIVDFERLTEKGFFGIFGPTGSGKSSILDAITYALYGKIVRDNGGFINLNEEKAVVKYTFEIGEGKDRKIYRIHRAAKKSKDGAYKTTVAKLCEINDALEEIILCEGKSTVDKAVLEIIGLRDNDFTRAVVLPQGKFSEFLKSTPKDRSEMLERLFGLERFGSKLTEKVKKESQGNNIELTRIAGELNSYQDVSEEVLKELNDKFIKLQEEEKILSEDKKNIYERYDTYKSIWQLQLELFSKEKEKSEYDQYKSLIEEMKFKLEKGNSALLIKPLIDNLESIAYKLEETAKALNNKDKDYKSLIEKLRDITEHHNEAFNLKENQMPELNRKEANLKHAIELKENLKAKEDEINKLIHQYKIIESSKSITKREIELKKNELAEKKNKVKFNENEKNKLFVPPEMRQKIVSALEVEKNLYRVKKELKVLVDGKELKTIELQKEKAKLQELINSLLGIAAEVEGCKQRLTELEKQCPGDSQKIIEKLNEKNNLEKEFEDIKEKDKKRIETQREFNKVKCTYIELEKRVLDKKEELEKQLIELNEEKSQLEHIRINNFAGIIAANLKEEDACPVCGNVHKIKLAEVIDKEFLESQELKVNEFKLNYEKNNEEYRSIEKDFLLIEANYKNLEKVLSEQIEALKNIDLKQQEESLKQLTSEYDQLTKNIDKWNKYREQLNKELNEKEKTKTNMEIQEAKLSEGIKKGQEAIGKNIKEIEEKQKNYDGLLLQYEELKKELSVVNFQDKYNEIVQGDKKQEVLEKELTNLRICTEELDKLIENKTEEVQEKERQLSVIKESGNQLRKSINEKQEEINNLSEKQEPVKYLQQIKDTINAIVTNEKVLKNLLDEQTVLKNELEKSINTLEKQKEGLTLDVLQKQQELDEKLKENNFASKEEAKDFYVEKSELERYQKQIKKHEEEYAKILNIIEEIRIKLNGNTISEEQWSEIQIGVQNANRLLDDKVREVAAKENEINKMKKDLERYNVIKIEKDKCDRKKEMLDQLEKLIKGNKFVEFAALGQLKYVTAEASRRLLNITKERFALQLSQEGEFHIKDNFSGGLMRSTNTLSGGELFLTSLSLALALSSHIQLKGSAPLEFFFLDEGFGTLDDELLDTVMNSLENLYSEKLSVGIISHVKELRDRVPIKLLVKPSVTGEGSKVIIENS